MKNKFKVKYKLVYNNKTYVARSTVFAYNEDEVQKMVYDYEAGKRNGWFTVEVLEVKEDIDVVDMFKNIFGIKI
jgi:L-2-hydroxyglutarate oxidase LhgO